MQLKTQATETGRHVFEMGDGYKVKGGIVNFELNSQHGTRNFQCPTVGSMLNCHWIFTSKLEIPCSLFAIQL